VRGLPAGVDEVVLQLLQKDPAARPENVRSAVAALERAAGISPLDTGPVARQPNPIASAVTLAPGASVPAMSPTQLVETPKRRPRAWVIVPVLAALAVLGVGVFALLGGHGKHAPAPPPPAAPPPRVIVQQPAPAPAPAPTVIYVPVPQAAPAPDAAPAPAPKPRPKRPAPKQTGRDDIIDVFGGSN
jgi:hypothetical protein